MSSSTADRVEADLRHFARLQVRSGLSSDQRQYDEVVAAVAAEMPRTDASVLARAWLAAAAKELAAQAATWPEVTGFDRLQGALAECAQHGVRVLQGADEQAPDLTPDTSPAGRGALVVTRAGVWAAVDGGALVLTLLRPDGTPVEPADPLLTAVLGCLERHGVPARFVDGQIEARSGWQRRPGAPVAPTLG